MGKILVTMVLLLLPVPVANGSPAVCNSTAGGVIFQDTLYGIGIGAVLTGLGMLAANSGDGQVIAGGAFAGGVVGLGVGIVDVATRDCIAAVKPYQQSVSLAANETGGAGLRWTIALP